MIGVDKLKEERLMLINSFNVWRFLCEEVVCRHGSPWQIVQDGGRENMDMTADLLEDYRI